MVTHAYMNRPDHTALAKIETGGRTRRCVIEWGTSATTMRRLPLVLRTEAPPGPDGGRDRFTVPAEVLFNTHDAVFRTALVGVGEAGRQLPVRWWSWRPACPPSASPDP